MVETDCLGSGVPLDWGWGGRPPRGDWESLKVKWVLSHRVAPLLKAGLETNEGSRNWSRWPLAAERPGLPGGGAGAILTQNRRP